MTKHLSLILALLSPTAFAEVAMAPSGSGLSLSEAMRMSFEHSYARRSSLEDENASEARQSALRGAQGPKLSVEGSRGWIDKDVNKLAGVQLPTGQRYPDQISALAAVASQPITAVFTLQDRLRAEQKLQEAIRRDTDAQGIDAQVSGAEAYIATLKSLRLVAIAQESRDLIQKQQGDADKLQKNGQLSRLDYSRFELAVSEAASQLLDAEARLKVAEDRLREVLGWDRSRPLQLQDVPLADQSVAGGQQTRKEQEAASQRIGSLEDSRQALAKDYWPQLSAFARLSRDFAAHDVQVNFAGLNYRMPKEDFRDQFSYGFNLQWDLWDWNIRSSRRAELSAQIEKAKVQREALDSRIAIERSEADAEWERATQNLKNAQIADRLSQEILQSFDTKFKNGLATTTDLLTVQRDRTRAQAQLASAGYDLQLAALHKKRADGLPL